MTTTIDAGWLPDLQQPTITTQPWTGDLTWRVVHPVRSDDAWYSADAWFNPPATAIAVVVGLGTVETWINGQLAGLVERYELRTWLAHGTGALTAGNGVLWTSRPMGLAIVVADCSPWPVPSEIATHLAGRL